MYKARDFLNSQGYLCAIVERTGRFIKDKDLFGIGDIFAIKTTNIMIVQVTSNRPKPDTPFMEFSIRFPVVEVMQMIWYDHKGWRFISYIHGKKGDFTEYNI